MKVKEFSDSTTTTTTAATNTTTTTATTTTKIYFSNKIQVYEYILSATILTKDNIKNNTRY